MAEQNKNIADETQWLIKAHEFFQGAQRDLGYRQPGYVKYSMSKQVARYLSPVHISLELPLQRAKEDIDKESSVRVAASGSAFEREAAALDRMFPELLRTSCGKFVAVRNGQVIDADDNEFSLARRIEQGYRGEFVLIRQVLQNQPREDLLLSPEWETV